MRHRNQVHPSGNSRRIAQLQISLYLIISLLLLAGCGGGGGEEPADARVEISGAILVPGGTPNPQNPFGFQGAANRPVSLYKIDDSGNIIGDVLETGNSDSAGNYVLLLPDNVQYSSDLIVEAQLGNNQVARAIVIDESTDITPITEYITAKLIEDPALDLSALPLAEVTNLIEFVESLPLGPQPDLTTMLAEIASFSDLAVTAEINDLATANPQIRLSGLLSVPQPVAPRPAPIAQRPIPNQVINLYRIDNDGNIVGSSIATTTTNSEGVFTLLLPPGEELSADLMLQAVVGTDIVRALVTNKLLNIDATSEYVFDQVTIDPDTVVSALPEAEVYNIVNFVYAQNIPEGSTLAEALADIDAAVANQVALQIDSVQALGAASPGFFGGSSNWNASSFQ